MGYSYGWDTGTVEHVWDELTLEEEVNVCFGNASGTFLVTLKAQDITLMSRRQKQNHE